MTERQIVVGPPGCGKTFWIAQQCERALERYGPTGTMVLSLTRAAAREAAGRTNLAREMVGTLHATCFRALGQPKMIDGAAIKLWNEQYPEWHISSTEEDSEYGDPPSNQTNGDRALTQLEICRHRQEPLPDLFSEFATAWTDFKQQTNLIDFTDMIEIAYNDLPKPPNNPRLLMVDEFQDFSNLELALVNRWAESVDQLAIVGDPNQSIYHWRHASRKAADVVPTIILNQSYRVPRAVQEIAQRWIRNSSTYLQADYQPREEEGQVSMSGISWGDAERLLTLVTQLDGSVMVLASCAYMLNPLISVLRQRGIPYHNPYRAGSAWNPLARGTRQRHTAADRVEAWLMCGQALTSDKSPTVEQILLLSKTMLRTAARPVSQEDIDWMPEGNKAAIQIIFTEAACDAMARGDLGWLLENSQAAARRSMEFPAKVCGTMGLDGLRKAPKIILGTIHSVKGGQADHVVLIPDLSSKGMMTYRKSGWDERDGIIRTFYVGMTRARQSLTILSKQRWAVEIS